MNTQIKKDAPMCDANYHRVCAIYKRTHCPACGNDLALYVDPAFEAAYNQRMQEFKNVDLSMPGNLIAKQKLNVGDIKGSSAVPIVSMKNRAK